MLSAVMVMNWFLLLAGLLGMVPGLDGSIARIPIGPPAAQPPVPVEGCTISDNQRCDFHCKIQSFHFGHCKEPASETSGLRCACVSFVDSADSNICGRLKQFRCLEACGGYCGVTRDVLGRKTPRCVCNCPACFNEPLKHKFFLRR